MADARSAYRIFVVGPAPCRGCGRPVKYIVDWRGAGWCHRSDRGKWEVRGCPSR